MEQPHATLITSNELLDRDRLALIPTPPGTATHKTIPHHEVVDAVIDTLKLRRIGVPKGQYAVSKDGMRMFGTMELDMGDQGIRYVAGIRNSHDKRMALGLTVGYRVMVCENMAFYGDFSPLMRKHTSRANLYESMSIGIDNLLRNYEPMVQDINRWRETQLTDVEAKLAIYEAFVEEAIDLPKHLLRPTHDAFFNPKYEDFRARNWWSMNNAFTESIKSLDAYAQQRAAASIGSYFQKKNIAGAL